MGYLKGPNEPYNCYPKFMQYLMLNYILFWEKIQNKKYKEYAITDNFFLKFLLVNIPSIQESYQMQISAIHTHQIQLGSISKKNVRFRHALCKNTDICTEMYMNAHCLFRNYICIIILFFADMVTEYLTMLSSYLN